MTYFPALKRVLAVGILALLPIALSACSTSDSHEIVASGPPPRPEMEMIPVIEHPELEIWRSGYWALSGNDFIWVEGRVISRPSPTASWSPAHWAWHTYGWSFEQGHWE